MVNAQEWLDKNYPIDGVCQIESSWNINKGKTREQITKLNLNNENLEGSLNFSSFINLENLDIRNNKITNLNLASCGKLEKLGCESNNLTNLDLTPCPNLKTLYCDDNLAEKLLTTHCTNLNQKQTKQVDQAQAFLEQNYPEWVRKKIKNLDLSNLNLTGDLDLTSLINLEVINISSNPQLGIIRNESKWTKIKIKLTNVQEWLNWKYSSKNTKQIIFDDNLKFNQKGELIISDYPHLEIVTGDNIDNITKVTIANCPQLKEVNMRNFIENQELEIINSSNIFELNCSNNQLTNSDFLSNLNPQKLTSLNISNNNFPAQDLTAFSQFVNLKELWIGNNKRFHGSLAPLKNLTKLARLIINNTSIRGSLENLKNMTKLKELNIDNTDLDNGVEYLPTSLNGVVDWRGEKKIYYSVQTRPNSKVKEIKWQLDLFISEEQKNWGRLGFSLKEAASWLEVGLKVDEYNLANYLQKERNLSPQQVENKLNKLKEEYKKYFLNWKNIHPDFTPELQKGWENRGFDYEECKRWVDAGVKPVELINQELFRIEKIIELTEKLGTDEVVKKIKTYELLKLIKDASPKDKTFSKGIDDFFLYQGEKKWEWKDIHPESFRSFTEEWENLDFGRKEFHRWENSGLRLECLAKNTEFFYYCRKKRLSSKTSPFKL